ncbi:MAG: glycosyltransferase family 2 protein [Sphingomonadales bacterium]|nr:MAG: glycosyltransferase family 2 protein [Sphingomonadales bacterium]
MDNTQAGALKSAELQTAKELYLAWQQDKKDNPIEPARHPLKTQLLISLTSYRPRLRTLHLTVRSLLEQTIQPDCILIWLTREDLALLPRKSEFSHEGVRIEICDDLRSYKKLVPALMRHPNAVIVTADDDAYYHRFWLSQLVQEYNEGNDILCHVAYRIHFEPDGGVAPYGEWTKDVQDRMSRQPSTDLLPIGVGGVLYPPGSLSNAATASLLFNRTCPGCDDLWFYAMAKLKGTRTRKVGRRLYQVLWPGTQEKALWLDNFAFNNDVSIRNLVAKYGPDLFA